MTREDFLREIAELDTEWHLPGPDLHPGMLRTVTGCCPLTALARARGKYATNKTEIGRLGRMVGIEDAGLAVSIVAAADAARLRFDDDEDEGVYDVELRAQMLEAVGLA